MLYMALCCACRREPEPTVRTTAPGPVPLPAVSPSSSSAVTAVSYADLCARSTPRIPTTEALNSLYAELGERLDLRAKTVLGAIRKDGVDPRQRHAILRLGAEEQGLKACPLANIWEAWATSDAG